MEYTDSVKFVYDKHTVEFPQTVTNDHKEVKLGPDDPLEDYFNSFYHFLMQIGFSKKEIDSTASEFFS